MTLRTSVAASRSTLETLGTLGGPTTMGFASSSRSATSPRSSWQTPQGGDTCAESREPGLSRARCSRIGGKSRME